MREKYFLELSRRLQERGIESSVIADNRLEVFLHSQPVLYVSPASDVFLLPAGSQNEEASELYHQVAMDADEVYSYVETMQNAPLLHASGLHEDFRLLADFGGAVLAGQERENGQGYQFVTWIWDYDRTGVSHGHYYAEAYMNQHGLSATDHGYVAWNGGEIYYEYSQPEQSNSPSLSM